MGLSLEVIGNPVGLFQNLSSGVYDFFYEPVQGFMEGPEQGIHGIARGAESLLRNTVGGVSHSVSMIASTVSSNLNVLSMDEDYQARQERRGQRDKPKNVLDGFLKGATSIGQGVFDGITGVVRSPLDGAKDGSVEGLAKGMVRGVAGAVVKPLAGLADGVKNAAEGIRVETGIRQRLLPIRLPRAMYGADRIMRPYNENDARVWKLVSSYCEADDALFSSVVNGSKVLILSVKKLIYVNNHGKLIFSVTRQAIGQVVGESQSESVLINVRNMSAIKPVAVRKSEIRIRCSGKPQVYRAMMQMLVMNDAMQQHE